MLTPVDWYECLFLTAMEKCTVVCLSPFPMLVRTSEGGWERDAWGLEHPPRNSGSHPSQSRNIWVFAQWYLMPSFPLCLYVCLLGAIHICLSGCLCLLGCPCLYHPCCCWCLVASHLFVGWCLIAFGSIFAAHNLFVTSGGTCLHLRNSTNFHGHNLLVYTLDERVRD